MLESIGVKSLEDLFKDIPKRLRFPTLRLPAALTEMEAAAELGELSLGNENVRTDLVCFLGVERTTITSLPPWTISCGAASSTQRILPTSRKFRRAHYKAFSNTSRSSLH